MHQPCARPFARRCAASKALAFAVLAAAGLSSNALAQLAPSATQPTALNPTVVNPAPELPTGPTGLLTLDKPQLDLGVIPDTESVTAKVTFKNTGEHPIAITRMQAHCGCTVPETPEKTLYNPGESGEITVTYDPRGKREGNQTTSFDIFTDSPGQPRINVPVLAIIEAVVSIDPSFVSFLNADKGAVLSQLVTVRARKESFRITEITNNVGEGIKAEIVAEDTVEGSNGATLREVLVLVTLDGTRLPGRLGGNITLFTNEEKRPQLGITVTGQVMGDVRANLSQWRMGNTMEQGQMYFRTVRLTHRLGKPVAIKDVEEKPSTVNDMPVRWTVTYPFEDRKDVVDIRFEAMANTMAGTQVGELRIITDVADEPPVQVTYFGNVRNPDGTPARPIVPPGMVDPIGPAGPVAPPAGPAQPAPRTP